MGEGIGGRWRKAIGYVTCEPTKLGDFSQTGGHPAKSPSCLLGARIAVRRNLVTNPNCES